MIDACIIGGGVSGLAAAYELRRRGHEVVVLERQARSGGNAVSERINGFLMEHGPSTINAAVPEVQELSASLELNASMVELSEEIKHRYLVKDGELSGISAHPLGFLASNYLTLGARLRLLGEAAIAKGHPDADETVEQYFSRRFGAEFADRVMDPLVGGLYAGRSDELSLRSVFPKLIEMEQSHGSISKAALVNHLRGHTMPGKRLYSWTDGIGSLPQALSRVLAATIRTGVTVSRLRAGGGSCEIETLKHGTIRARSVLIATQPHVAATFLQTVAPEGAGAIAEIAAPPLAVVFLGYKRTDVEHPLDGLGYLSPRSENSVLTGAQFPSSMFAGRAPQGHVALTGYLGGARHPEVGRLSENELINLAQAEFKQLLGIRGEPVVSNVRCWPRGIPQYRIGHWARVAKIENIAHETPGVFVTGNYLNGPAVGACVANAQAVADNISVYLNRALPGADEKPLSTPEESGR